MSSKKTKTSPNVERALMLWETSMQCLSAQADGIPLQPGTKQKIHSLSELMSGAKEISLICEHAEKLSEMLHAKCESLKAIQEALSKQPVNALTLLRLISLERERGVGIMEEYLTKKFQEEKKKRFELVQKEGIKKKIEIAHQLDKNIATINADLLAMPASEGWGSKKKRVDFIAKKTGNAPSYISKKIAKLRKTNQT